MKNKNIGLLLAAGLLIPWGAEAQDTAAPGASAAGNGTVIFFREKKMLGAAVRYKVRENDVQLCKLGSGTFCMLQVPAGTHNYDVHTEAKDKLTLDVKPNETYYVVGSISMGAFAGHPKLTITDKTTFDGMKAKLKDNTGKDLKDDKD
ncbi:MAG TPA: hypothetical protein VM146_01385 [Steroidobacteraceae bacterium]|nr:hypothetical protein [Steroidobacteraceae bacterium]